MRQTEAARRKAVVRKLKIAELARARAQALADAAATPRYALRVKDARRERGR